MRHPHIFYGGLALSPPLTSFGASTTVRDNPLKFAVQDWTANVYWDANAEAALKIKTALDRLWTCIQGRTLSLESPMTSTQTDHIYQTKNPTVLKRSRTWTCALPLRTTQNGHSCYSRSSLISTD